MNDQTASDHDANVSIINFFKTHGSRGLLIKGLPYDEDACPLLWAQIRRSLRDLWQVDFTGLFSKSGDDHIVVILHANMACVEGFDDYRSEEEFFRKALDFFHSGQLAAYCEEKMTEVASHLSAGHDWQAAIDLAFPERPIRRKKEAEKAEKAARRQAQQAQQKALQSQKTAPSHGALFQPRTEALA